MKKSLLVIIADQLSFRALSVYGNEHVKTPHLDAFFKDGYVFDNAYTTCPLCLPARSALWSGRYAHETGAMSNGRLLENPLLPESMPSLGDRLSSAGYRCVHLGKTHDSGALRGFEIIESGMREEISSDTYVYNYDSWKDIDTCDNTITVLKEIGNQPFAVIADFNNPHNICNFTARADSLDEDAIADLPPLPPNFNIDDMETRPLPVQYLCCSHNRQQQAAHWQEIHFRQYIAAYYHYIEMLDQQLGEVFAALEASGQQDNTVVCFCADHGDNMGSRRMTTKHSSFYEETVHVPLRFAGPGIPAGRSAALVSHLDLLPTFCAALDVPVEDELWGKALQPVMNGECDAVHDYVASEWYSEWGFTIEPCRMIRGDRFKYTRYIEGGAEELYDMQDDPYELHNLAADPQSAAIMVEQRVLFERYLEETNDDFLNMEIKVDERWRSHAPGFHHHQGPTAPQLADA